jgi:hypothetical protein
LGDAGAGAHAAVADAGQDPVGYQACFDAGGMGGATDRARDERVAVHAQERIGVEAVFVVVFGVFRVFVVGEGPGRVEARQQAQEQGKDQGQDGKLAGVRAQVCDRLSGGVQRGGVVRGMGHCLEHTTNIRSLEDFFLRGFGARAGGRK